MLEKYVLTALRERRSIRKYKDKLIPDDIINKILDAGRWAPSGLNNQPWRFVLISNKEKKHKLSELTHYGQIVEDSALCIGILYFPKSGYDRKKDTLSIGACIQNILLASHSLGIGSVWLGEILKNSDRVMDLLELNDEYELMALIALGFPDEAVESKRLDLEELLIKQF